MSIYQRWQVEDLKETLSMSRIVLLAGPRQCGKSTLAKNFGPSTAQYRTLDDATFLEQAHADPEHFVKHQSNPLIIDEIQRAPDLLIAIKKVVDEDTKPGQFLLTGSANLSAIPTVRESLAGRIMKVRLRTLSQGEILGFKPTFLQHAFDQDFQYSYKNVTKDEILLMASKGGYPEPLHWDAKRRAKWHAAYIKALLERDLQDIANIHKLDVMTNLVEIMAAWSSKFMDKNAIGATLGVKWETLDSYMNALSALFLLDQVPAWHTTDYDRVGKRSKIFMTDSGLMFSMLGWNLDKIKLQTDSVGKLVETYAYQELATQIDVHNHDYTMYHYRDREKREIDFLIQRRDKSLLGIEIKTSSVARAEDFKHLKWFGEKLAKQKPFVGIVLYTGDQPVRFGENYWAVPFGMLWQK